VASLDGRITVITGAGRGLGRSHALLFAAEGAKVVVNDLGSDREGAGGDPTAAESVVEEIRAAGGEAVANHDDVASWAGGQALIQAAIDTFGGLDVLVNNAGFQHVAPLESFPTATFRRMLDVMLVAPFVALRQVLPGMKAQGWGRVVNVASINGLVGFAGKAGYNSAKHGLIGLTKVAALEAAAHGVTVNAICPGYVDTPLVRGQLQDLADARGTALDRVLEDVIFPLVPQRRLLDVAEVVDYVLFLASERARGVTGQAVVLDGGYTAQ
jgi:3-hydroxybutyrate dehydrogenase